jgi:hypothetical protein
MKRDRKQDPLLIKKSYVNFQNLSSFRGKIIIIAKNLDFESLHRFFLLGRDLIFYRVS